MFLVTWVALATRLAYLNRVIFWPRLIVLAISSFSLRLASILMCSGIVSKSTLLPPLFSR